MFYREKGAFYCLYIFDCMAERKRLAIRAFLFFSGHSHLCGPYLGHCCFASVQQQILFVQYFRGSSLLTSDYFVEFPLQSWVR